MCAAIAFEFPWGWLLALPLGAALVSGLWAQNQHGAKRIRLTALGVLRAIGLAALVFLIARPIWKAKEAPALKSPFVALLMDRSESMSLEEGGESRYQKALKFL